MAGRGNPEGVAALTLRTRLAFQRDGTNTNGPQVKELEVSGINQVDDLVLAIVPIDLEATARLGGDDQRNPEQVHDEILTIIRSSILVPFEYGTQAAIYVKARMLTPGELQSDEVSAMYDTQALSGKMVLSCAEAMR